MNRLLLAHKLTYQTFERFGVSGAWWAQVVGGWDEIDEKSGIPKNDRIAELLFDKEKGIGIRCYRYNLGAGSAESGNGDIPNVSRRTESFDAGNYKYDWSKDKNAVLMMKKAVEKGVDEVIFFVNSPIERLTKNHKSHSDKSFTANLDEKEYSRFAKYCLDCVEHFRAEGIPVKYLSPVNEPVWKCIGGQDGSHYKPTEVWKLFRVFSDAIDKRPALSDLKLSGAENGDIRWFNKTYCRLLLGDIKIKSKMDAIDVHSYFLCPDYLILKKTIGNRLAFMKRFRKYMDRHYPDVPVKTSEWTHMKGGRDYGMKSALEQTKVIMEDLKYLNVTSWQLWIALSNVDYCDGLIYEFDSPRAFRLTKRYFAYGNFTKFSGPGSVRFEVNAGDNLDAVGFKKDGRFVIVISNRQKNDIEILLPFKDADIYITSERYDLVKQLYVKQLILPGRSVTTIVTDDTDIKHFEVVD